MTLRDTVAYRSFWNGVWSSRVDESPEFSAGRQTYSEEDTAAQIDDIVKGLALSENDRLLDVGCGKGLIGGRLRALVKHYVGLDYVAGFHPLVVGDAIALPFADAAFDKVLLAGVLLCIGAEDNGRVLQELRRVTRSGGRALVGSNPFTFIHHMTVTYDRDSLMALALTSGWATARITPINPRLDQAQYYFDMVLE